MALRGLRVVEMAGLAPAPFAGMILAGETARRRLPSTNTVCPSDFGASVIRVDKTSQSAAVMDTLARLHSRAFTSIPHKPFTSFNPRNKRSIAVNLKHKAGVRIVEELCSGADVFIEPYRPGVMEKLGLGPQHCLAANPRLVYARLTGFGQTGPLAHRAGHDINYLAISGVLSVSPCPDFLLDCYPETPGVVSQTSAGLS